MGKSIIKGIAVLCLLLGISMPQAMAESHESSAPIVSDPQSQVMRQKFFQDRLDHITEVAGLTAEEKAFVSAELTKYDDKRIELFKKGKELRDAMAKPGLTDKEYASLLEKVLDADLERTKETLNLFKRLESKLSPEKRAKVYVGLRTFNAKVAQKIRAPRK